MTAAPLTWAQHFVWSGQQILQDQPHYNQAYCVDLHGALDMDRFRAAFERLVAETDALRLVFEAGETVEQRDSGAGPELEMVTVADRAAAQVWMEARGLEAFDLAQSATRAALISISNTHHVFFIAQHHIVTDGVAAGLILERLGAAYSAAEASDGASFIALAPDLAPSNPVNAFDAASEIEPMRLYGREAGIGGAEKHVIALDFGAARLARLKACALSPDFRALTPLMATQNIVAMLVAGWLSRITGQSAVAFASPQHNRLTPLHRGTAGLFVEMLPLAVEISKAETFATLFAKAQNAARNLMVRGGPGTTRADLMRNCNVRLNIFAGRPVTFAGLEARPSIVPVAASDPAYDLNIEFEDLAGTGDFRAHLKLDKSRFDPDTAQRAAAHFIAFLDAFLDDPTAEIARVDIRSSAEKTALETFNRNADTPQPNATVLDIFTASLSDAPALRLAGDDTGVSHIELDHASNRLAHLLLKKGAGPGDKIAIHMPRSIDMIVAIWAVFKIGAAYVPLQANLPANRRDYILEDTGAALVITDASRGRDLSHAVHVAEADAQPTTPSGIRPSLDDTAYVIYTSGSTGNPKGVAVAHRELIGYVQMMLSVPPFRAGASYAFATNFGFDTSINPLFMSMASGGEIVVYPESDPSSASDLAIIKVFADDDVDVANLTPSHLPMAMSDRTTPLTRLNTLIVAGEAFHTEIARRAQATLGPDVTLLNQYGPTEIIVGTTLHSFNEATDNGPLVPLGNVDPGMRIYVLNEVGAHQPIGVPGEIVVCGRLAQGYYNRAELTAEKFAPNPYRPGERMYHTGDLGVFQAPGDLHYLGRMDDQVKLNGIRLELGEVEHIVMQTQGVTEAVAAVQPGRSGAPVLVAYVIGAASRDDIVSHARAELPPGINLAALVFVETLPFNANGKIERKKLPIPADTDWLSAQGSRAPDTVEEKALAEIWAEVLGLENVGAEDDFYALGGDSLGAVRITHKARDSGLDIAVIDVFRSRTIATLARSLKTAPAPEAPAPRQRFSRLSDDARAQLGVALRRKP